MRVLLLDTAFAAAPIYDFLIACGHNVWVAGNRSSDLLARRAGERWMNVNYSDASAVEECVRTARITRIVPGCTDVSLHTALQLSAMKDVFDTPETNALLADKSRFRALCEALAIKAPRPVDSTSFPRDGRYICKPVDAFSGRGCSIFHGTDDKALNVALQFAKNVSPSNRFLIEEFVEGQLHSCTGFVEGGRVIDTTYVLEGSSVNPFAVDTSYVTRGILPEVSRELEGSLSRLARHLQLRDGLLHTQFILAKNGAFVIEVSRRCPGDLYPLLIEYSTGTRFAARYASYFTGDQIETAPPTSSFILRHTIASDIQRIFPGTRYLEPLPMIAQFPILSMGGELEKAQKTRAQVIFCQFSSSADLHRFYKKFMAREMYEFRC